MDIVTISFYIACVLWLLLNSYTSYRVLRCELLEPLQKSIQLLIIWLLPLLGGIIILAYIHTIEKDDIDPPKPPFGGGHHDTLPPETVATAR